MWGRNKANNEDIYEQLNDPNIFGTCKTCGETTSNNKLEEFKGDCEDCFYDKRKN